MLLGCAGIALGLGFAGMAIAPTLALGLVGAAIAGIGNGIESSAAQTAVQQRTPSQWMALIMSLYQSISQIAPGVGIIAGGAIVALAGTRVAWVVAAAGSLLFAVGALVLLRAAALGGDPGDPPDGPAAHIDRAAPPAAVVRTP
jgi:MFS family permease